MSAPPNVFIVWCLVKHRDSFTLDDWGLIPSKGRDFFLCHHIQAGSGVQPALCPMGTGTPFLRGKLAEVQS
jgi:hypothetical protein